MDELTEKTEAQGNAELTENNGVPAMEMPEVFSYKGFDWKLKYTIERIQMVEDRTGKPFMSIGQTGGFMTLSMLYTYFSYGLCNEKGEYISAEHGLSCAREQVDKFGYGKINGAVISAIQRDCGFFFRIS